MNEAKERDKDKTPLWQVILGSIILLSFALLSIVHGLLGRSWRMYERHGGGVLVEPWQQIAGGVIMLAFTIGLIVSEVMRRRRQGGSDRTGDQTDTSDD